LCYDDTSLDKGNRMIKFGSIDEVDGGKLAHYIHEAIRLNIEGIKVPSNKIDSIVPDDLKELLNANDKARAFFEDLAKSYKRDYVEWIER
tara:strand:- start:101 stop:370 length:270 start_codon:yes stop_codon:yes gene_type:complete